MESLAAEFKLVLVGDSGVGKTTFVRRHLTGEFQKTHIPTMGVEVISMPFYTSKGKIGFNIWDTAGKEEFGGLKDVYYIGGQCCIIMFDVCQRISYKNVPQWYKDVTRVCPNIPICLVGNKVDSENRKLKAKQITFHRARNLYNKNQNIQYYDISAKSNYQFEQPFVWLLKKLIKDPKLSLVNAPEETPAQIAQREQDEQAQHEQWMQEMKEAEAMGWNELPDDDDDF